MAIDEAAIKEFDLPQSLIPAEPEMADAVYGEVFGGEIKEEELMSGASFDWREFMIEFELQAHGDCVSFSRNNAAELVAKKAEILDDEDKEFNLSDLDLAVGTNTTRNGNHFRVVAEYARKTGVRLERHCKYTRSWDARLGRVQATPRSAKHYKLGNWSWVRYSGKTTSIGTLKSALKHSPLQIGVPLDRGWHASGTVKKPSQYLAWHGITLLNIDKDDQFIILDQYDRQKTDGIKTLASDYPVVYALSFRDLPEQWRTVNAEAAKLHARLVGKLILRAEHFGELYRVYQDRIVKIGVDVTDPELREEFNNFLKGKHSFIGISEADFEKIASIVEVRE